MEMLRCLVRRAIRLGFELNVKVQEAFFENVDLLDGEERAVILADMKKFNPRTSFPTIIIGEKVIVGYKEEAIRDALVCPMRTP